MVDFRKAFLLLAVIAVVAILPLAADPMTCSATAGTPPPLRSEGVAEEVGQVTITCTGGVPTAHGVVLPTVNVQIILNTYITSKLLYSSGGTTYNYSEALLMLDEPASRNGNASNTTGYQTVADSVPNTSLPRATGNGQYLGGSTTPVCTTDLSVCDAGKRPNVFVGQQLANNSVTWLNIPFDAPGTSANRVIRIVNVRAYANYLGVSSASLIPTSVSMFISISGTASLSLSNPQLTVGYVQQGMDFSTSTYTNTGGTLSSASSYKQCVPPAGKYYTGGSGTYYMITLNFAERFGTAFRQNISSSSRQDVPGTIYNTESMFYNPDFAAGIGGGALGGGYAPAGLATQPTRLIARFYNVPNNVTLYIPTGTFTSTDSNDTFTTVASSGVNSDNSVALTSGAGTATFEAQTTNPGAISTLKIPVYVYYTASTLPDTGTVTVTGNYAPTTTTYTAAYNTAVPRFVNNPQSASSFTIIFCKTNLLFPWVTNYGGWDTGIAISNTSADPFGTVAQAGTCTLYYYGTTNLTAAAPGSQTSTTIAAGSQLVFTVSNGATAQNIAATPGFQGYMIATCNFQYAHAYAFVSDQGSSKVAEGYLALVLDQNMFSGATRTAAQSEVNAH